MKCGIQYELAYVKQVEIPHQTFYVIGRSVHETTQKIYTMNDEKRKILKPEEVLEIHHDIFNKQMDEVKQLGLFLSDEEKEIGEKRVIEKLQKGGGKISVTYHKERISKTTPIMIEHRSEIPVKEIAPHYIEDYDGSLDDVILIGYIDLADVNENIIDLKTTRKKPSQKSADRTMQLTIYTLGFIKETGILPSSVILDYVFYDYYAPEKKPPQFIPIRSIRTQKDIEIFLRRVLRVVQGIKKGVFLPPDQLSWVCNNCIYKKLGYCKIGY